MQLHASELLIHCMGGCKARKNNKAQPRKGDTPSFLNENGFKRQPVEPMRSQ